MFAVEKAGQPEAAKPTEFARRLGDEDTRPERHSFSAWWCDVDAKATTGLSLPRDTTNERIPSSVSFEVEQDAPYDVHRSIDPGRDFDGLHRGHPSVHIQATGSPGEDDGADGTS
jgi:hypothetical protein